VSSDALERRYQEAAVRRLVDRSGRCRLAYEPIADLARGEVCGYEAVPRVEGPVDPERWHVVATRRGLEPDLDAFVIGSILRARESLPAGCFLSFDAPADVLLRERVRRVLARAGGLEGLVVELSSRVPAPDLHRLLATATALREAGAKLALDGVGRGAATLQHAMALRPEFVKLDARLVNGIHRDDARRAIVETLGELASRLDAWVVVQGVERIEDLDALVSLRVPLAQGPLVGVRAKTLTPVAFALSAYVRERGAAMLEPGALVTLLERPAALPQDAEPAVLGAAFEMEPGLCWVPLVDARRRPVGMLERAAHERGEPPAREVLAVGAPARVPEVLRRAMLRPPATRFHPVVCCDESGRYVGIARIERLVDALAAAREREG